MSDFVAAIVNFISYCGKVVSSSANDLETRLAVVHPLRGDSFFVSQFFLCLPEVIIQLKMGHQLRNITVHCMEDN